MDIFAVQSNENKLKPLFEEDPLITQSLGLDKKLYYICKNHETVLLQITWGHISGNHVLRGHLLVSLKCVTYNSNLENHPMLTASQLCPALSVRRSAKKAKKWPEKRKQSQSLCLKNEKVSICFNLGFSVKLKHVWGIEKRKKY